MTTYAEQLARLDAAIAKIEEEAQEYSINGGVGGRSLRRGDLATMYAERARLEGLAAREARGGGIRVRRIMKNS